MFVDSFVINKYIVFTVFILVHDETGKMRSVECPDLREITD